MESSVNRLLVITDVTCSSGSIKVTVGTDTAEARHDADGGRAAHEFGKVVSQPFSQS